ncbi:tyrosine-type recombinase/integrase [Pseudonocardia hispaniensis]|uniref:Tyrosine-type recombinase/integrase n=1 Tax=Pseudonocardia hispaniensis TaxID=904933 RepID=A0ABW1IZB2_9PSEU
MSNISKTPAGNYRANWREPSGRLRAKTFRTKKEAARFLAELDTTITKGTYVDPHAGRMKFEVLAERWLASRNDEATTRARDASIMRNHVVAKWGEWPLGKIDHLAVQEWISALGERRAPATVAQCHRLLSAVLRSAVRSRIIAFNPCEGVRLPKQRKRDTDHQVISRDDLRGRLLPVVPTRYRALVGTAAGTGLRWGEATGLCLDALDLDRRQLRVIRTVVEVSGNTRFKAFPKSAAGRRTIPLPAWLLPILAEHLDLFPAGDHGLLFGNSVGKPLRRTLFRSRVWRPALVRAGLLGQLVVVDEHTVRAGWTDGDGGEHTKEFPTEREAVQHLARSAAGGLRFHDLRHSYATWLVDDGVPINMVQRVMGHERSTTTLDLYTRRTDGHDRILRALGEDDDEDGPAGALVPVG